MATATNECPIKNAVLRGLILASRIASSCGGVLLPDALCLVLLDGRFGADENRQEWAAAVSADMRYALILSKV